MQWLIREGLLEPGWSDKENPVILSRTTGVRERNMKMSFCDPRCWRRATGFRTSGSVCRARGRFPCWVGRNKLKSIRRVRCAPRRMASLGILSYHPACSVLHAHFIRKITPAAASGISRSTCSKTRQESMESSSRRAPLTKPTKLCRSRGFPTTA